MENPGKQYYGIKEVADLFQINASKLRYYEKEFPTLQPKKNRSGDRVYTQADINHLKEIFELINEKGLTLPGAREELKNRAARRRENARFVSKLQELKTFLDQLRQSLD
ncbi:MerR family transcriptional regulator [Spirosoma taeanense]|uniref:MerR family transcriptional regulator n=1 Tax=Spirosoma taeanense TaxID=2735870 RepID=A0A6M5Y7U7_9BACT|nr:MerR family transcriptional regulator [Spirosoma taeanense]QJW89331.1 MerR family transcriptional regulator [Spirosoma taeanense]